MHSIFLIAVSTTTGVLLVLTTLGGPDSVSATNL